MFSNLGIISSLAQKKRFRNARHKCTLKLLTDLKSRNMIALSNIDRFIDASSKLFSVALRGYTYKQITVYDSFKTFCSFWDANLCRSFK